MGPISKGLFERADSARKASTTEMKESWTHSRTAEGRAAWDRAASFYAGAETVGFSVSSTGLRVMWKIRVNGRRVDVSLDARAFDRDGDRHAEMFEELLQKCDPPGLAELVPGKYLLATRAWLLLEAVGRAGETFVEDSFRAADEWARAVPVMGKRRAMERKEALEGVRKSVAFFLDRGGDADDVRRALDEAIVGTVVGS